MSRARVTHPATAEVMEKRILRTLNVLPMNSRELRWQVAFSAEDERIFATVLRGLRAAGAIVKDARRASWLRLANTVL